MRGADLTVRVGLLVLFLFPAVAASLFYGGSGELGWGTGVNDFVLWEIRVPKTITAILAGSSLAVAGLILQVLFRNPLAGPYVLGISSGASLMVAAGMLAGAELGVSGYFAGRSLTVICAVAGGLLLTMLILAVSARISNNIVLLLMGLMFGQVCGAIQNSLEFFADPGSLKTFVIWGMGSLAGTTNSDLIIYVPVTCIALASLVFFVKPLNALLLGNNYAHSVGISFRRTRFALILISSVLTGVTTAFCGPVAFVGIAVPILSRMLLPDSSQGLHLFTCIILGACIVLFSDAICHSIVKGYSLPINMITTVTGAPLVIYLMFRQKQW